MNWFKRPYRWLRERWAYDRLTLGLTIRQRYDRDRLLRDRIVTREVYRMKRILMAAKALANQNAAIHTSTHVIGDGVDKKTAAIMLQWLEQSIPD